ncbi:dihydropteroate synthase [Acetobacteraceae bacterium H6797]|nr:dihydropteroate synthase [Acetobacteraceae bacterium H6797]
MERWLEPLALLHGPAAFQAVGAGAAMPLHGGSTAFALVRRIAEGRDLGVIPVSQVPEGWHDLLDNLTRRPGPFAGIQSDRPLIMGILNVTPDSFSDGGKHDSVQAAIAAGHAMLEAGADILDIGGESTRPGSSPVDVETEKARILPVVRELAKAAPLSVDTRHAKTMLAALEAGAEIINDITALRGDPDASRVVARAEVPVILMHMRGLDPKSMQQGLVEGDIALDVAQFLRERVKIAGLMGIPSSRIAIDPGLGFGKTAAQNWQLIERLPLLMGIGCHVMMALSRKGFLGKLVDEAVPAARVMPSAMAAAAAAAKGASILRVHDVKETLQALAVWRAAEAGLEVDEDEDAGE